MGVRKTRVVLEPPNAKRRHKLHLACEEMDFTWCTEEVKGFETMWLEGIALESIAKQLERDPDEVLILLIDRARRNKLIIKRQNGLLGWTV